MPPGAVPPRLAEGFAHHRAGRLAEAERCYADVLDESPQDAEALHHLALVRHQQGRGGEALELLQRALALDATQPRYHFNLATILAAQGRPYQAALSRAVAWQQAGRPRRAEELLRPLLERRPDDARVHLLLGDVHAALNRAAEAEAAYRRAGDLAPESAQPWLGLAELARGSHRFDDAQACLERALVRAPHDAGIHIRAGHLYHLQNRQDAAVAAYRRALELAPADPAAHAALVYCLHFLDDGPGPIRAEAEAWAARHAAAIPRDRDWPNDADPERVLQVGIVSPDLRAHPDGQFLLGLLRHRDPARMRITCYSEVARPDFLTRELHAAADGWVRVHGWSDAAVAERLRADRIDVLLDPTGFQSANRLRMHARKPVPLQVGKIGYLCTRGLREFDGLLTDPLMTPPELQRDYVERLLPIPSGHFVYYPPPRFHVPVAPPPALLAGHVTFGSFNNSSKITPRCIALWARVLAAVPDAALYLRAPYLADAGTCERMCAAFAAHGIAAERLRFGGGSDKPTYLADFARIDVHLDTVPNNGVTTTCDSLWMGVPVVALWGSEGRSRAGATLVTRAGHPEWAAADEQAYVRIAVELAAAPERLAAMRHGLRAELEGSPLCDGPGHARALEAALRDLWRRWCAGRSLAESAAPPSGSGETGPRSTPRQE